MSKSVTVSLSDADIKAIDALIKLGVFSNRSDFITSAARKYLREEYPSTPDIFERMQAQAKKKGLTRSQMLKDLKQDRRKAFE
jgi:Arc/MetJ-type ribon-helix-helix transcriptional regulator